MVNVEGGEFSDRGGVVIRRFLQIGEALGYQAFLESRGLKTVLVGDNDSATIGITSVVSGGIKIFVPKAQLNEAQSISREYDKLMSSEE